jgi:hypothetical protein
MFHFLNRFIVRAQVEPGQHFAHTALRIADDVLAADSQSMARGHGVEELGDVPVPRQPGTLRIAGFTSTSAFFSSCSPGGCIRECRSKKVTRATFP